MPAHSKTRAADVATDANGSISTDIICRKCGYNLRGLSPEGRCPECGIAVGRSLFGNYLRFADHDWLQKLVSGLNWIILAIVADLLLSVAKTLMSARYRYETDSVFFFLIDIVPSFLIGIVSLWGYWLATTPNPHEDEKGTRINLRKIVRVACVAQFTFPVLYTALPMVRVPLMVITVASVIAITKTSAVALYGRKIVLLIPNERLARHCDVFALGLVATYVISMSRLISLRIPALSESMTTEFLIGWTVVAALGFAIFGFWAFVVLLRLRSSLREFASMGKTTWAGSSPEPGPPTLLG